MIYERLTDMILFSIAVAFTVIGIHQSMVHGIAESYWIFMLVFTALIVYNFRKQRAKSDADNGVKPKTRTKK